MTYAGQSMTEFASVLNGSVKPYVSTWRLIGPSTGSNNVVVNLTGGSADKAGVGAVSYTGVDQTTPIDGIVTGETKSTSITQTVTSETDDLVQDAIASLHNALPTVGAGQTERWAFELGGVGTSGTWGGGSTEPGTASVTMDWTVSGNKDWAAVGFNINNKVHLFVSTSDTVSCPSP